MEVIADSKVLSFWNEISIGKDVKYFIYMIKCRANNKVYIGKTNSIKKRCMQHVYGLRNGKHANKLLQKDYDQFGEDAFSFEVLAQTDIHSRYVDVERNYILKYQAYDPNHGYNSDKASRMYLEAKQKGGEILPYPSGDGRNKYATLNTI